jgi:hypothetical protein
MSDEKARRKRAVFESMSKRRREWILKKGYEKWDPFQDPKDPIDIRRDPTRRTLQMLVSDFFQSIPEEDPSSAYRRGVIEMALGIVNGDERYLGMYAFSCWYREELAARGAEPDR